MLAINVQCQNIEIIPAPYRFSNFKNSPAQKLAEAVQKEDISKINTILSETPDIIDYKEQNYGMNLLCLAIANNKRKAFMTLIEKGANVNEICGIYEKTTPLLTAIEFLENCNSFFIERLIMEGCDINLKVFSNETRNERVALFELASKNSNIGKECIDLDKLLISKGADLNLCVRREPFKKPFSIIDICLFEKNIDLLIYLFKHNLIEIPNEIELESIDGIEKVNLVEYLKSEEFDFPYAPDYRIKRDELIELIIKTN